MKWIVLFPFLPLVWAWKWSGGAAINGESNFFAHLIGCVIIAGILYSIIGFGIMKLLAPMRTTVNGQSRCDLLVPLFGSRLMSCSYPH